MDYLSIRELVTLCKEYDFFIIDKLVYTLYEDFFGEIQHKAIYLLERPESQKRLSEIETAANFFFKNNIKRESTLVSIGGGATSDFCGMLASILYRGISWVCIPTTILSIVDASIGGKTAVNTDYGKNLLGSFHEPLKIVTSLSFLESLDQTNIDSGLGEVLKYAYLSKNVFDIITQENFHLSSENQVDLFNACQKYKQEIVSSDFKESGVRKFLNYGHTLGHALEKCLNLPHGIAVAIGIEMKIHLFDNHLISNNKLILKNLKLSAITDRYDFKKEICKFKFQDFLERDKKSKSDSLILIRIKGIGEPHLEEIKTQDLLDKIYHHEVYGNWFK